MKALKQFTVFRVIWVQSVELNHTQAEFFVFFYTYFVRFSPAFSPPHKGILTKASPCLLYKLIKLIIGLHDGVILLPLPECFLIQIYILS
jgi:hypothetical protein